MSKRNLYIVNLGCFRNTYDTEIIVGCLLKEGYRVASNIDSADTIVINTCGFIDEAKKESIEAIYEAEELKRRGKIKRILVYGCLYERYRKKIERYFKRVDMFKGVLPLQKKEVKTSLLPSHLDFLKISEGCLNRCSYCAIPIIKGPLKSKPYEEIIGEVKLINERGIRELNIIGQDITSWGKDIYGKSRLPYLLEGILKTTRADWVRLLYTHPVNFTDELIEIIAEHPKICKYIDLPIQHINDRILKLMNRRITKREIISLIEKIRNRIKDVFIRTSIIVGFPTENEREFEELLKFIEEVKFERLGAFIYSREEGTEAFNLPQQIHYMVKRRRLKELMTIQETIADTIQKRFVNNRVEVIIDRKEDGFYIGRTPYDAYEIDGEVIVNKRNLRVGNIYNLLIKDNQGYDLIV